jgi:hypothetical protein
VEHRNLLPVRAYYFSKDEKLLVYDYLPNGSLSAMLHGTSSPSPPFFFRWFFSCYAAAVVHTEIVAVAVALAALLVQFQPVASLLGFALVEFAVLRCQPSSGSSNLGRIPKFTPTWREKSIPWVTAVPCRFCRNCHGIDGGLLSGSRCR